MTVREENRKRDNGKEREREIVSKTDRCADRR